MAVTDKKLGRVYDPLTMTWRFSDGSGIPIPQEVMSEYDYYARLSGEGVLGAGAAAIGVIVGYKDKMSQS